MKRFFYLIFLLIIIYLLFSLIAVDLIFWHWMNVGQVLYVLFVFLLIFSYKKAENQ